MKNFILFSSISVAAGLLFVNLYTSLVDSKAWASEIPNSIATTREYFKTVNPGNFFRLFSPVNQVLALLVLILFWKSPNAIRLSVGAAFLLYVLGDVFTFAYFYPRNDLLWKDAQLTDISLLTKTVSEWRSMNWVRSLVILTGLVFSFLSLHKIYSLRLK
jgi:hypothetical protein